MGDMEKTLRPEVTSEPIGGGGGFITEVDVGESKAATGSKEVVPTQDPAAASALPLISVYRVEDADLPSIESFDEAASAPLPESIPVEKVMTNIVNNLDFEGWSERARNTWFKDFCSTPSRAVISDTFWYCICWYFKPMQHTDMERALFDRISANYVQLFSSIPQSRKDFFFRCYYDAISQAVLYSMFLAYPKSRVHFTESFRKDLIVRIAYWTTGICPEFVDTSHWKLNLGGGDVLQSTTTQVRPGAAGPGAGQGGASPASHGAGYAHPSPAALLPGPASSTGGAIQQAPGGGTGMKKSGGGDSATGSSALARTGAQVLGSTRGSAPPGTTTSVAAVSNRTSAASLARRAPRPVRTLRYSPLVAHFLRSKKYSSVNLVRAVRMALTCAEERCRLMDLKHQMLLDRAHKARQRSDEMTVEYEDLCADLKRQEKQKLLQTKTAKKKLEIRRKEVLRSDPHEYANYLVSLNLLQQIGTDKGFHVEISAGGAMHDPIEVGHREWC